MIQERKPDAPLLGIGAALASMREAAGITKRQMELKANIGRAVIDRIEKGRAACSTRTLHAYLEVCGHDLAALLLSVSEPKAASESRAPKGKKGHDYSLLPPLTWRYDESVDAWVAMEMLYGWIKDYQVTVGVPSAKILDKGFSYKEFSCTDVESGKAAINDWRFVHGHKLS